MQIAVVAAGFTPSEADRLRRSLATFKKHGSVSEFSDRFIGGMLAICAAIVLIRPILLVYVAGISLPIAIVIPPAPARRHGRVPEPRTCCDTGQCDTDVPAAAIRAPEGRVVEHRVAVDRGADHAAAPPAPGTPDRLRESACRVQAAPDHPQGRPAQ